MEKKELKRETKFDEYVDSLIGVRVSDISKFKWVRDFYDLRGMVGYGKK